MSLKEKLKKICDLDLPYDPKSTLRVEMRESWVDASVLILFNTFDNSVLFTVRTDKVETHKGQIAFPGGMKEVDEDHVQAALRETYEEVGIDPTEIEIIGSLPNYRTVTGFEVMPFIGVIEETDLTLNCNQDEISHTFWVNWSKLIHSETYAQEKYKVGAVLHPIDVFYVGSYKIWGVTGSILKNLVDRFQSIV